MPDRLDPHLGRNLAEKARAQADDTTDIDLQQSYFELTQDYETLAETLERIRRRSALVE